MVDVQGVGVHTGSVGHVRFRKHTEGFHFELEGFSSSTNHSENNFVPFLEKAQYGTVLKDPSTGKHVATPEHLLAVLAGYSFLNISVECQGDELPIGNGSGQLFLSGLEQAWGEALPAPRFDMYTSHLNKKYEWENGFLQVEPASTFTVQYQWNKGAIQEEASWNSLENAHFTHEIIPARTFITWKHFLKAKAQGLLQGVSTGKNKAGQSIKKPLSVGGVLLAEEPEEYKEACQQLGLGNGSGYPYIYREGGGTKNECARHKILDLIGDLALLGLKLPKLSCKVVNGGHYQHHQLLRDLFYEQQQQ
jgi:UDP-3-O-acyl-N-acetylglucosamine deacetylase